MIPCNDLFLEIEVPDPSLNYFILNQDKLDNQEHFLGKKNSPIFKPLSVLESKRQVEAPFAIDGLEELPRDWVVAPELPKFDVEWHENIWLVVHPGDRKLTFEFHHQTGIWSDIQFDIIMNNQVVEQVIVGSREIKSVDIPVFDNNSDMGFDPYFFKISGVLLAAIDVEGSRRTTPYYKTYTLGRTHSFSTYNPDTFEFVGQWNDDEMWRGPDADTTPFGVWRSEFATSGNTRRISYRIKKYPSGTAFIDTTPYVVFADWENNRITSLETTTLNEWGHFQDFVFEMEGDVYETEVANYVYFYIGDVATGFEDIRTITWYGDTTEPIDPNEKPCEPSGQNTFVIEKSCLGSDVDLLEGWGAAKPDYIWVDLISDAAEINIERGFDPGQGIIGSPLAGVLDAVIIDPTLEGIATQRLAIGQKFRLRAGRNVVFTGVVSRMKSTHNAVDVPTLEVEALDAFGILNAQMVEQRDYESYKTRMLAATEKVGLTSLIQDTDTILNPTDEAMSGLDLLKESQDSEGSICWVDRHGTFYSTNRYWNDSMEDMNLWNTSPFYGDRRFSFYGYCLTPIGDPDLEDIAKDVFWNNLLWEPGNIWNESLASFTYTTDTSQVINGITFYNTTQEEEEGTDEDGNTIMEKVNVRDTHTFESATSRRFYGDASVRLQTYLPTDELVAYADHIFSYLDTPKPRTESFTFVVDRFDSSRIPETTTIEIGEPIGVWVPDADGTNIFDARRVASIRHSITPQEWVCEINTI